MEMRLSRVATLLGVLALCCTPLVLFALLDQRAPVGHEPYYITEILAPLRAWTWSEGPLWKLRIATEYFLYGEGAGRPPLAQTALLATLGIFGTSIDTLRLANLPFLLTMLLGVYFGARTALSHRASLLAVFAVATLPAIVFFSRTWVVQFHAACLSSAALALAILLLRGWPRVEWVLWLAFGVVQGFRFYTNPVALPDIAVLFVLLALFRLVSGLKGDGPALRATAVGLGLSAFVVLAISSWYLGLLAGPLGEPDYSFPRYWANYGRTAAIGNGLAPLQFDLVFTIGEIWRDLAGLYWMPGYLSLILLPGLICTPIALARGWRSEDSRLAIRSLGYLAALLALEFPLAVRNIGTGNGTLNWLGLAVPSVLTSIIAIDLLRRSLPGALPRRVAWLYAALLLVVGGAQTAIPLTRSAFGADPDTDPDAYEGAFFRHFTCSEYCIRGEAFHVVSRTIPPGTTIARRMRDVAVHEDPNATIAVWDLGLMADVTASLLDDGTSEAPECSWGWLDRTSDISPGMEWLFMSEGFRALNVHTSPEPGSARFHVVRLFYLSNESEPIRACESATGYPQTCLEEARSEVLDKLGTPGGTFTLMDDPTHTFGQKSACDLCQPAVARCAATEVRPGPVYIEVILVVDRGEDITPAGDRSGSSPTRR